MSSKKEKFEEATKKVEEKIEKSKPATSSSDSGRPENERGHTNINPPQNER
jgi:hypothetical protein